jgi:DNA-binding NarL/FixJ family response regulator
MGVVDDRQRARDAYQRHEWVAAYQALSRLDDAELAADDFTALATAAYLLGRRNDCIQALQRAFQSALDRDDVRGAARTALWLAQVLFQGGEGAIGSGWLARARRLLDEISDDVVERGYLLQMTVIGHLANGEFDDAIPLAPQVTEHGRRFDDADLFATGLHTEGRLAIYAGRVAEGLRLLDEAMVGVLAGEVSPIYAGLVYCSAIESCQEISDFGRVAEWTQALTTWCDAQPGLVTYTGQCAVHRGQLMRLHGAFDAAVQELERAAVRYAEAGGDTAVGLAHYERGEVLRLRGHYDAAGAAFDQSAEHGHPAQPGRALLWCDLGRVDAATAAIHRLLAEPTNPPLRSQLLPAAVEVLVAAGDQEGASEVAAELAGYGASFGCTALRAAAAYAAARVSLARRDANTALPAAGRAAEGWVRLHAPYEIARCRVLAGRALQLWGDEESAAAELVAARRTFAELGAAPAEREVAALLGGGSPPGGLSPREVEVLRLVAAGRSNPQIAAELVLSEKTVARHLSNIFSKLDVGSRTAAAAFAYEHRLV